MGSGSIPSKSSSAESPGLELSGNTLGVVWHSKRLATLGVTLSVGRDSTPGAAAWQRAAHGPGWVSSHAGLDLELSPASANDGLVLTCTIRNASRAPVTLREERVALTGLDALWSKSQGPVRALKIAYCGANSRSPKSRSHTVTLTGSDVSEGWWVGAVAPTSGGPGVVIGALDFRHFATSVLAMRERITVCEHLEGWVLAPGETVELAPLWLGLSDGAPLECLERYASEVGRRHEAAPAKSLSGWGSWGHYLESIDADLMHENLIALEGSTALRESTSVVQIDDGWSELLETDRVSASWHANRRFPSGIAPVAAEVGRRGKRCGLWILPFTVNAGSALALEHPEFLVQDEAGGPTRVGGGESYCLDPTHPGARAWLTDLLSRIRGWGVGYLKLDFLRTLLAPDPDAAVDGLSSTRRYHAARTRVEAYRAGLELVRAAVGPDVFLVGCSAPGGPGAGLVDAHRVGPDIEPSWSGNISGIRDATRSLAANFFWQGRAWSNDPDYLMSGASLEESRFWATAVALSGGSSIVSADATALADWQERLFALATPPLGQAARPLDLFASDAEGPRLWHLPLEKDGAAWHLMGFFNWDDRPCEMSVDLRSIGIDGPAHIWNVWRSRLRDGVGRVPVFVEGHSATLLAIRARLDRPQIVGTDLHFSQGMLDLGAQRWSPADRTLVVEPSALKRSGHVFVWAPPAWRCVAGGVATESDSVVSARLAPSSPARVQFDTSLPA